MEVKSEDCSSIKVEIKSENCNGQNTEFREQLVNSMRDIASSVSRERYSDILGAQIKKELFDAVVEDISKNLLGHVGHIESNYKDLHLEQQKKNLQRMSLDYPSDHIAWRPTSGVVNINALHASSFRARKNALFAKMEALDAENEILRQTIISKRKALEEQQKNLLKIDIGPLTTLP